MKPSLNKLIKILNLEAERGYDNRAVLGGLERFLEHWEADARADALPEDLIQVVVTRLHDYPRLSESSRLETLEGLIKRIRSTTPEQPVTKPSSIKPIKSPSLQSIPAPDRKPAISTSSEEKVVSPKSEVEQSIPTESQQTRDRVTSAEIPKTETAALNAPITVLPGVGPRHAQTLSRLGLFTLRDMLYFFPRRYDDYSHMKSINRLEYREEVTVIGTVQSVQVRSLRAGNLQLVEAILYDGSGKLRVSWFNQVWIAKRLHNGAHIVISGKVDQFLGRLTMNNPEWEPLDQGQLNTNRIVPVYALTANITQHWIRRILNQVISYWAARLQDPLPRELRRSAELVDLTEAISQIHFPDSWEDLKKARHRLAFDEIFLLQLGVLRQKRAWQEKSISPLLVEDDWLADQIFRLPFPLTNAQQRALEDIRQDLASGKPMNRLLQGDVGSGKTVIAALAIAMVANNSAQAAFMAPTSILAEQHYRNLSQLLTETINAESNGAPPISSKELRLLTGDTPEWEKSEIRAGLENGLIKVVIGTHALIVEPVAFKNLQLAIIDEQHRFGVEQRATLRSKGANPHLMVMTATPIPRSLALTVYGDLDLTVIDEMPPGRQEISTFLLSPYERERAYTLARNQIQQGRQVFIIYPLIEESERSETKSAVEEHTRLQRDVFPEFNIGLLHGRMRPDEKEAVMSDFRAGKYDILVSTSVVEVGVDIPNATLMIIEGANRFGLAQLHQFRGRVGRGAEKSFCLLIPDNIDATENERLQAMVETNDGFVLAERDLEQRGPGQFFGTRQAGYSELNMANLSDVRLIEKARRHAQSLFDTDPGLSRPELQPLLNALHQAWGDTQGDIS